MDDVAIAVAFETMLVSVAVGVSADHSVVLVNACRTPAVRSHDCR